MPKPLARLPRHPRGCPDKLMWLESVPRGEYCDSTPSECGRFEILTHWDADPKTGSLWPRYELVGRFVRGRPTYPTFSDAAKAAMVHT